MTHDHFPTCLESHGCGRGFGGAVRGTDVPGPIKDATRILRNDRWILAESLPHGLLTLASM